MIFDIVLRRRKGYGGLRAEALVGACLRRARSQGQGQNLATPQWLGRISKVPAIERKPEELWKRIRRPQRVRNSV